ncbi:MAG: XdhC family protein [Acidimicrobiales bacterium]
MNPGNDGWTVFEEAATLRQRGEPFALATVVWRQGPSSGKQGCRAIITASGEVSGWIGGACSEPIVIRLAQSVIAEGVPKLLLLGTPEQFGAAIPEGMVVTPISCQSEGALEVYIEPVLPTPHLVVVGRSPMAHTLSGLAQLLGWRADEVDSPEFNRHFSLDLVGPRSMVVIATQGHGDEEAVQAAVATSAAYIGLVASARRGEAVLGYAADRGIASEQLARVQAPAGLDLGPTTHQEIAVGILAQLVQLKAAGRLGAGASGVALAVGEGRTDGTSPEEATDPVCGMTVTVGPGARSLELRGTTYYFCCPGCRRSFEKDPAAYVELDALA